MFHPNIQRLSTLTPKINLNQLKISMKPQIIDKLKSPKILKNYHEHLNLPKWHTNHKRLLIKT